MKTLCTLLLISCFIIPDLLVGQSACDSLVQIRNSIKMAADSNVHLTDTRKRKLNYDRYVALNNAAVSIAERCILNQHVAAGTLEELKNYYLVGKLYYQCGKCEQSHAAFNHCLGNPLCSSTKIKGAGTYAQIIGNAFTTCQSSAIHESASSSTYFVINYSGKGGAFVQGLFNQIDPSVFDDTPLTSDELEEISDRTVWKSVSPDSDLVFHLSGNKEFVLKPPFLFMKGKGDYSYIPLKQEKNLGDEENGHGSLRLKDFSQFVFQRYKDLSKIYFDKFNSNNKLISFYIVASDYSAYGLRKFLAFCDSIHFRAHQRVAYYMPADNSIVAWAASGGGTLVHEMIHSLIAGDFPSAPLWLNEGLASLYEETSANGVPADNYRLIFIQQSKVFIKLSDLMDIEKYQNIDEINYNLLNAYNRYLCKFIYDVYGPDRLVAIYKQIRNLTDMSPVNQMNVISEILGKKEIQLQEEWQQYVIALTTPNRYRSLVPAIAENFLKHNNYVFVKSEIPVIDKRQ